MYLIIKIFSKIVNLIPVNAALTLGKIAGLILYLNRNKRIVGFRNLKSAFPYKTSRDIFSILRASLVNFGISVIESFIVEKTVKNGWVDLSDINKIKPDGNGVIVGIHAGSWEIYNESFARRNKLAVIIRRQKNYAVDRFLREKRIKNNIAVCFSLRSLVKYMHKGYWVGIVVDQGAESNALYIDFFGSLVPVPRGAVYIAKKFDKKIYPMFGYRIKGKHHYMEMGKTLDCSNISEREALIMINRIYEEFLTHRPEQYTWWYKRFKRKRNVRIVVLSDGKTGHFKQSLSLKPFLEELGYRVDLEIVEIKGIGKLRRFIIEVCALFFGRKNLGNMGCLKMILDKNIYNKLSRLFADIVISAGSSIAGVNVLFGGSLGAKSIAVLKPNLPVNKFDLVIVPEHDRFKANNVVNIKGALSAPINTDEARNEFFEHFKLSHKRKVSLFIGGPIAAERDFKNNIRVFVDRLKNFAEVNNFGVLVTTSRRTPGYVEAFIEKEFSGFKGTEALVIVNRKNYPFILGGFLAVSSFVFVTSDSISMISESLGAEKTTVCVELEEIFDSHHINFIASMEDILNFVKPPYTINKLRRPDYSIFEYNRRVVKEAISRIL